MFLNLLCVDVLGVRNACFIAWGDGANQAVVMLIFQPGATRSNSMIQE